MKTTKFPDLPSIDWTIVTVESPDGKEFYGLNTKTGQKTKQFSTYAQAIDAIPEPLRAEPWGV